jgi:hypothetical protein
MMTKYLQSWSNIVVIATLLATLLMATGSAAQDFAIDGIWVPDGSRSQRVPANLPYTTEGQRIASEWQASHDPIEDDPGRFCQSPGMPSIALSGAGYPTEIAVTSNQVLILLEAHQQVRRVFLDTIHPERPFAQRNGHSIGHWEGNTLVVDTVGIRPITFGAVPHSDQVQIVERLRVIDAGSTLINEVTINDPVMYNQPIVVERYYTTAPEGTRMLEYECSEAMWIEHEESRGREPFAL